MQLDDTTLDLYLARGFDGPTQRTLDDHVAGSLDAALLVEARMLEPERWERRGLLGRLVRVVPPRAEQAELERAA